MKYYSKTVIGVKKILYLHFEVLQVSRHLPRFSLLVMATPDSAHVCYTPLTLWTLVQPTEREDYERIAGNFFDRKQTFVNFCSLPVSQTFVYRQSPLHTRPLPTKFVDKTFTGGHYTPSKVWYVSTRSNARTLSVASVCSNS